MDGAFLWLSAFFQKRGRRFCFLGRFFVFLSVWLFWCSQRKMTMKTPRLDKAIAHLDEARGDLRKSSSL